MKRLEILLNVLSRYRLIAGLPLLGIVVLAAAAETADSKVDCERISGLRGDWRSGTESRQEAEQYLTSELNQSLSRSIECAKQQVSASNGATGSGEAGGGAGPSAEAAGAGQQGSGSSGGATPGVETAGQVALSETSSTSGGGDGVEGDSRSGAGAAGDASGRASASGSPNVGGVPGGDNGGPVDVDRDGSYAAALREAYAKESDPNLRAAIEAEYRKLTGKRLSAD